MGCALSVVALMSAFGGEGVKVGDTAPPIKVSDWQTAEVAQEALKGKPYVLEFWATWCPPCRKSIPHLVELKTKYPELIMISAHSKRGWNVDKVKAMMKSMKINYAICMDSGSGTDYHVRGIPTAVVVGADGKVAFIGHPMRPQFGQTVEKVVKEQKAAKDEK